MSDIQINGTPIPKLRVVDLKNELDARGLSKSGKKDELVARLLSYLEAEMKAEADEKAAETEEEILKTEDASGKDNSNENQGAEEANLKAEKEKALAEESAKKAKEEEEKLAEEAKAENERKEAEKKVAEELQREKEAAEEKLLKEKKAEEEKLQKEKKAAEEKLQKEKKAAEESLQKEKKAAEESLQKEKKAAEEKLLKEKKAAEEKLQKEKKAKEESLKKEKNAAEERKIKESNEQEERQRKKIAAEEREKEEIEERKLSEKRKQKDVEERKRLEEEERLVEEETKKKNEDRKTRKESSYQKKVDENDDKKTKSKDQENSGFESKKGDEKNEPEHNGKYDESLIIETAADDTLVMEIDQADIVAEEVSKEDVESPMISAEPGQVTSLRRLGGSKSSIDTSRKRGWGASKGSTASANSVTISSNSLKDLVPDIKPLLDTEATIEEEVEECSVDSDADVAGPKIPENVKKDSEPVKKRKRIPVTDLNETAVVLIINLTRPFTVNQLKEMLKRTGTIVDFWIDRIKSMCCVQFSTVDQASETRMALDGVTWPQGNPKTLRVSFSTEEELKKYQESSSDALNRLGSDSNGRLGGVREWDKNKLDQEQERAREREKRLVKEKERREGKEGQQDRPRERSLEKKAPAVKSLEDLFKKTAAAPAIYWKPLSEEQIKQKIEARNKKIMEAQIMREMMDTKESLQRSNKLLPARRRSSSGSSD